MMRRMLRCTPCLCGSTSDPVCGTASPGGVERVWRGRGALVEVVLTVQRRTVRIRPVPDDHATRSPSSPTWPGSPRARSATTSPRACCRRPGQSGPGAKYGDEDLARLRLIRRLQRGAPTARRDPAPDRGPRRRGRARPRPRSATPPTDSAWSTSAACSNPPAPPRRPRRAQRPDRRSSCAGWPARARRPTGGRPRCHRSRRRRRRRPPRRWLARQRPSVDRSQWERIALAPDVELHVRRPLSRLQNKRVDRLVTIARELLEEDRS